MNNPQYHSKFVQLAGNNTLPAFLQYFESLNQADWSDFLDDVLRDGAPAWEVLKPNKGDSLLVAAMTTFEKLGCDSQKRAADGLFLCIERRRNDSLSNEAITALTNALRITNVLPPKYCVPQLMLLAQTVSLPLVLRREALRALAHFGAYVPTHYWSHVDISTWPEAAGVVTRALSETSPDIALEKLKTLRDAPDETSLEYPLRMVIRNLQPRSDYLNQFMAGAPRWLQKQIRAILEFSEFAGGSLSEPSGWTSHCTDVAQFLPYSCFRYFSLDDDIPSCLQKLLYAYRKQVASTLGCNEESIRPFEKPVVDTDLTVDDTFRWRTFLVEPGYWTGKRRKDSDIVPVGHIKYFAAVAKRSGRETFRGRMRLPKPIELAESDFRSQLAVNSEGLRLAGIGNPVLLSELYRAAIVNRARVIAQPSTTNADELAVLFETFVQEAIVPPSTVAISPIGELEIIKDALLKDDPSKTSLAILDWRFGVALKCLGGDALDLYIGAYDDPIPVGYFFPKGDTLWAQHLQAAFNEGILSSATDCRQFVELMCNALVTVGDYIKVPHAKPQGVI
jgi:hypothetical protein